MEEFKQPDRYSLLTDQKRPTYKKRASSRHTCSPDTSVLLLGCLTESSNSPLSLLSQDFTTTLSTRKDRRTGFYRLWSDVELLGPSGGHEVSPSKRMKHESFEIIMRTQEGLWGQMIYESRLDGATRVNSSPLDPPSRLASAALHLHRVYEQQWA